MSQLAVSAPPSPSDLSLLIRSAVATTDGPSRLSSPRQLRIDTRDGATAQEQTVAIFTWICWMPPIAEHVEAA
jgi:hypothetical protein